MTLIEILVAMAIFSLLAGAGYAALDQGLAVSARLATERAFWQELDSALNLLAGDLGAAVERAPRSREQLPESAFRGEPNAEHAPRHEILALTRGGHASFRDGPASPFVRVVWRLDDGVLTRLLWPRIDRPYGEAALESEIAADVTRVDLRFLAPDGRWLRRWSSTDESTETAGLPRALEFTLSFARRGPFTRVFHVGATP